MAKKKLLLDAGHFGYYNQSPANKNYYESLVMWKLHLLVKKYLETYGFEVITTRADQTKDLSLTERGKLAVGCVGAISYHSNAVGSYVNESVDYALAYSLTEDKTTMIDEISKELGKQLVNVVTDVMGLKQSPMVSQRLADSDRNGDGVLNDNYYGFLHGCRLVGVPGIILEHSFHTNTKVTNWLLNDSNLEKLAKAESETIATYFGMTKKEEEPKVDVEKWYRIRKSWDDVKSQLGAYKVLESAIANCPVGYSVYDWNGKEVYSNKPFSPYMVRIDVSTISDHCLNIREKASASSNLMGCITTNMTVTIVAESTDKKWGLLKSYEKNKNGWINLSYTTKVK